MEGSVVHLKPPPLVLARPEGSRLYGRALALIGQRPPHLQQVSAALEPDGRGDLVVQLARLRDPQVDVAAPGRGDLRQGCRQQVVTEARLLPPVGVDDVLDRPAGLVTAADLRIADHFVARRLPRHEPRKALAAPLDEVEPLVLAESPVTVCRRGSLHQPSESCDLLLAHPPLDLDFVHR